MNRTRKLLPLPHSESIENPHELPLTVIEDLIYYDGPVLSHVKDPNGNEFLYLFINNDDYMARWLIIPVDNVVIGQYKSCISSLLDLCIHCEFLIYVDVVNLSIVSSYKIATKNIPESELPTEDSYFDHRIKY